MNNSKKSKYIHNKLNWKNWGNRKYMNSTLIENQVNLYKSLFLLYNIKSKNMSLLEIGAGHGDYTLVFEKLFKNITAIDPEKILIEKFNKKIKNLNLTSKIETHVYGCEDFVTLDTFDFIVFSYSFMWINNKQKCLLNITKLLKDNGYILLMEPSRFVNNLDTKFIKQKELMIDTLETFFSSKKLKLKHFLTNKGTNIYLFQKI
jgi:ubiquinone/menaquinone biosynthesis C-methylase UbiE